MFSIKLSGRVVNAFYIPFRRFSTPVSSNFWKDFYTSKMSMAENSGATKVGPVEETIRAKLSQKFQPSHFDVMNESYMHNVPKGSETHFKVIIVTPSFDDVPLIERHRMVNDTLKHELSSGVHALSIVAQTPNQFEKNGGHISKSPPCLGGSKR